jgi:CRISPR-associated endonuclease/helicase Cas3
VSDIVQSPVAEAQSLARDAPTAVGIIVNRVAIAKDIYSTLTSDEFRKKHPDAVVELVIGSMRPIDRDRQADAELERP